MGPARSERFDGNTSSLQEASAPAPPDIPFELVISGVDADWCPPAQSRPVQNPAGFAQRPRKHTPLTSTATQYPLEADTCIAAQA
jgi:hypothetical protein